MMPLMMSRLTLGELIAGLALVGLGFVYAQRRQGSGRGPESDDDFTGKFATFWPMLLGMGLLIMAVGHIIGD